MSGKEVDASSNDEKTEQIVQSNGFSYNNVFCINKLSKSQFRSPTYVCGNNKFQILIDLTTEKLSISLSCNDSINNFGSMNFDFFVTNKKQSNSLYFNEKSKLPIETQLNYDDINEENGWLQNGSFRTVLVTKDVQKEEYTENQKLNHEMYQKILRPVVTNSKEKIDWLIPNLSEWHTSEKYDIKFADVIFILLLEDNYYNFSMSFDSIQRKEIFIKAKFTLNNKDPAKSITKNIFECITSNSLEPKSLSLSEIKRDELTAENGWIVDNCLKITVEFINPIKYPSVMLSKKVKSIEQNKNVNNHIKLPVVDYVQSIIDHGCYFCPLNLPLDDAIESMKKIKIRVGKLFAIFSLDISKKISGFDFENIEDGKRIFSSIKVTFLNSKFYNSHESVLNQFLSKSNSSISFDTPYDSKTVKEGGWAFGDENSPKNIKIKLEFGISSESENTPPFEPVKIEENICNKNNKKYEVNVEIPLNSFKSPIIYLPTFLFDSRKMTIFITFHRLDFIFNAYLEGFSDMILNGKIEIVNLKDPSKNGIAQIESFKQPLLASYLEGVSFKNIFEKNSAYVNESSKNVLLRITFSTVQDSQVYLPSEPSFEKYISYESEKENSKEDNKFESRTKIESYAGLINQGATCYMNSMLQAFFHLPAFRKIVYSMPTSNTENPEKSIPLNLQRLFCEMQLSKNKEPCSTENLTKSFGWTSQETFVQHDVEEFCRVLMDNLQSKMEGDPSLENSIKRLFGVKSRHAVRCMNVNYQSIKEEELLDIQLNVEDCQNLEESFKKYIAKEVLDGDNQYITEEFGKQDAVISEEFVEFPPVLHIHLKRFIFDLNTMKMTKLNNYYEFPEQIDLAQYLASDAPGLSKSNLYDLYGVLVHSGGILGGHYNAYLRTSTSKQWYFFNDSHVTPVSTYKAVNANYGYTEAQEKAFTSTFDYLGTKEEIEERSITKEKENEESKSRKSKFNENSSDDEYNRKLFESTKNGYMLIYVRHEDAPMIFAPIPEQSVPHHLIDYVNGERANRKFYYQSPNYDINDKSYYVSFNHEDDMKQITVDNVTEFSIKNNKNVKSHKINEPIPCNQLYQLAAKTYNIDVNDIRIWYCSTMYVPIKVIPNSDKEKINNNKFITKKLNFFVQKKNHDEKVDVTDQKLIFLKFFFPGKENPLQFLKSVLVKNGNIKSIIDECCEIVIKLIGLPKEVELFAFVENVHGLPSDIRSFANKAYSRIDNGQILIFAPQPEIEVNPPTDFIFAKAQTAQSKEENTKEDTEEKTKTKTTTTESSDTKISTTSDSTLDVQCQDDLPVYKLSDYFEDFSLRTLIGYLISLNSIEFNVYDLNKSQLKALFKIVTPNRVLSSSVIRKIIEFAHLDFNPNEDTIELYTITPSISEFVFSRIDTEYYHTDFVDVFNDKIKNYLGSNKLFFLHRRKAQKKSILSELPSLYFSFDAKSIITQFCIPRISDMNLNTLVRFVKRVSKGLDIGDGPFRLLKVQQHRIVSYYVDMDPESEHMFNLDSRARFRLEVIPPSQTKEKLKENNGSFVIRVCYAREKTYYSIDTFGDPFLFDVLEGETFDQTLVRLRKFLEIPDSDDLSSYKFMLSVDGNVSYSSKFVELLDGMKLSEKCTIKSQMVIFTSGKSKSKKPKRQASNEIKIYN